MAQESFSKHYLTCGLNKDLTTLSSIFKKIHFEEAYFIKEGTDSQLWPPGEHHHTSFYKIKYLDKNLLFYRSENFDKEKKYSIKEEVLSEKIFLERLFSFLNVDHLVSLSEMNNNDKPRFHSSSVAEWNYLLEQNITSHNLAFLQKKLHASNFRYKKRKNRETIGSDISFRPTNGDILKIKISLHLGSAISGILLEPSEHRSMKFFYSELENTHPSGAFTLFNEKSPFYKDYIQKHLINPFIYKNYSQESEFKLNKTFNQQYYSNWEQTLPKIT